MGVGTPIDEEDSSANRRLRAAYAGRVVDEQGRRRLHGAWRGGFSAGYYNTVGSAEGWAPSAFRSSRGARAEAQRQRAEEFMDDEDFEEANATLRATEAFAEGPGSARSAVGHSIGTSARDTFAEVFSAAPKESAGVRLLRQMGWREGSGVGARSRARVARDAADKRRRVLGPSLADLRPQPPPPTASVAPQRRRAGDERGLGFQGSARAAEEGEGAAGVQRLHMDGSSGPTPVRFGVSAFEDGDEDIYAEPSKEDFDRELTGPAPTDVNGRPRRTTAVPWRQAPSAAGVLPGFAPAAAVPPPSKTFEGPTVPEGFEERHVFETTLLQQPRGQAHDAGERAAILGEQRPPPPAAPVAGVRPGQEELQGAKLDRYQRFLRRELYADEAMLGPWQREELQEFRARAAAFRAIPQAMRGRFTTASVADKEVEAQARADEAAGALLADLSKRFAPATVESAAPSEPQALWRESFDWAPAPLLCRRFKEDDPYLAGVPDLLRAGLAQARGWQGGHGQPPASSGALGSRSTAELEAAAAHQGREAPRQELRPPEAAEVAAQLPERPSMSIFRAVFADEDSDEDSDEDE